MHFVSSTVTACAACRASDKKRVLYHHTMSARARTTTGSRERGRPRAVPGVLRENHLPQQTPAQSHSHPLSLFCVSHDISSVPCSNSWNVFRCDCHSFHRIFGSFVHPHAVSGKPRATIARPALVSFSQNTRVCWSLLSTTHHKSMSAPRRRHGGRALPSSHTAPLYLSRHTHPHAPVGIICGMIC